MKTTLILFATMSLALHARPVYFGTAADGIYLSDFDESNGSLSPPTRAVEYPNPGFLALHPTLPILYSTGGKDTTAAFSIGKDASLALINSVASGGRGPCHIAVDQSGRTVALANYGEGSVVTIRLGEDGKPGEIVSNLKIEGTGPHPQRQKQAHTHGVYFDHENRFLFAPDLGADKVAIFSFDPETSTITPAPVPSYSPAAPGAGPRHMTFSRDRKNAYIINELDNTLTAASYNATDGTFESIATYPTLPEDFTGKNTTSEVEVHPSGSYVYASNRGHDSIVVFKRDPDDGSLEFLQHAPCGGRVPRHFAIDPTGKWLICAHQDSDSLAVLPIDPASGKLSGPTSTVEAPRPICVIFPHQ